MTNLDENQLRLLEEVSRAKAAAEVLTADAHKRLEEEVWKIEEGLRAAARAAHEGGVPLRRIGNALGTSDHGTQKAYVSGPRTYEGDTSYAGDISTETNDTDERIYWKNEKEFTVFDMDGVQYDFWILEVDGYRIVNRGGDKTHPITEYVRDIIKEKLPDADTSEL